ncbi:hypothetical protein FQA39_LY15574 [Lamprigera yunnana]|nr:hypothetical protein FQA39_LY15574 [Lamprigera yunnana]
MATTNVNCNEIKKKIEDCKQAEAMTDNNDENKGHLMRNKSVNSENESNNSHSEGEDTKKDSSEQNFGSYDSVVLEREEGDGQESVTAKRVDDDEDKKNPQYIPKRGTFYEHDDRTLEDSDEKEEGSEKSEKQIKKNVWLEKKERWGHDRFNVQEQLPKSRSELVAIYGYDIRNEDGPPKARRRRRYGRGPNKYTRTWEDEDAYKPTKPVKIVKPKTKKKEGGQEEVSNGKDTNAELPVKEQVTAEEVKNQRASLNSENKVLSSTTAKHKEVAKSHDSSIDHPSSRNHEKIGTGRVLKSKPEVPKEIKDSDYKGFTKSRQFRNSKIEQKVIPTSQKGEIQKHLTSREDGTEDVQKNLEQLNFQEQQQPKVNKVNNLRQNSIPPRLQGEQKGSKRYSSLRQRSLPETAVPTFNQAVNYYTTEYNQPSQPTQQPPLLQQPATVTQIPPPPLPNMTQQVQIPTSSILQASPQFVAPFPQAPPGFLPPAVAPAPFIPQQSPIINYVPGQAAFQQPAPYQTYPHQQFNAVNQAAELYQCQGGTTYYSTQNQHIAQRIVPQKRPKAAIPILPPPPQEHHMHGRPNNFQDILLQGDEMYETVITESSNNYEDNIVYVHQ